MPPEFFSEMGNVLAIAERVAEFSYIRLNNTHPVEARGLRAWNRDLLKNSVVDEDLRELCQFLLKDASRERSIITISPNGVYLGFVPQQGQKPKLQPDELIGKTIAEVIGQAAHDEIVQAVRRAQATAEDQFCNYEAVFSNGEKHRYTARVSAKPDGSVAWLAVARLTSAI
ncbi:MAG TPA: PAS domain-containing protein [Leptolyngbyaceae cyanobacterium]